MVRTLQEKREGREKNTFLGKDDEIFEKHRLVIGWKVKNKDVEREGSERKEEHGQSSFFFQKIQ